MRSSLKVLDCGGVKLAVRLEAKWVVQCGEVQFKTSEWSTSPQHPSPVAHPTHSIKPTSTPNPHILSSLPTHFIFFLYHIFPAGRAAVISRHRRCVSGLVQQVNNLLKKSSLTYKHLAKKKVNKKRRILNVPTRLSAARRSSFRDPDLLRAAFDFESRAHSLKSGFFWVVGVSMAAC